MSSDANRTARSDPLEDANAVIAQIKSMPAKATPLRAYMRTPAYARHLSKVLGIECSKLLGKPLMGAILQYKDLTKSFKFDTFFKMIQRGQPAGYNPPDWVMSDSRVDELMKCGLQIENDTPLPDLHNHHRFENPLVLVFFQRYDDKNRILLSLTPENEKGFSIFLYDGKAPTVTNRVDNQKITLPFTIEQIEAVDDWYVAEGTSYKTAIFKSKEKSTLQCKLDIEFKTKYGPGYWPDLQMKFDFPDAAKELKDDEPTEEAPPITIKTAKLAKFLVEKGVTWDIATKQAAEIKEKDDADDAPKGPRRPKKAKIIK